MRASEQLSRRHPHTQPECHESAGPSTARRVHIYHQTTRSKRAPRQRLRALSPPMPQVAPAAASCQCERTGAACAGPGLPVVPSAAAATVTPLQPHACRRRPPGSSRRCLERSVPQLAYASAGESHTEAARLPSSLAVPRAHPSHKRRPRAGALRSRCATACARARTRVAQADALPSLVPARPRGR